MKFIHHDLGQRRRGEIVEVTLSGNAANVQLVDSANLTSYRAGRQYRYYGGHVRKSPVQLAIPSNGHWHVVVDLGGHSGGIRSSAQVLGGALPELKHAPPALATIADNAAEYRADQLAHPLYDVFISHASDDKDSLVRPLARALVDEGLTVWYDEFELQIGDSLRRKIDGGLSRSRYGVVVLSPSFFAKNWPQYELDGLVTREMGGEQIILPLWHGVGREEVVSFSPSLADKVALDTSTRSVEEIATELAAVVAAA